MRLSNVFGAGHPREHQCMSYMGYYQSPRLSAALTLNSSPAWYISMPESLNCVAQYPGGCQAPMASGPFSYSALILLGSTCPRTEAPVNGLRQILDMSLTFEKPT